MAEGFERLRDASDALVLQAGGRPRVFLANLGRVAQFTTRSTFAKNLFEAGGIEAVTGAGGSDPAAIAKEYAASGAALAVLCSSDAVYENLAEHAARALRGAGATVVYLAGRPGEGEAALRDAGVDEFVFVGCDVLQVLEDAHERLETMEGGQS